MLHVSKKPLAVGHELLVHVLIIPQSVRKVNHFLVKIPIIFHFES
jgi:hypothetical protein